MKPRFLIAALFILVFLPIGYGVSEKIFPMRLTGDLMTAAMSKDRLWFETDASFYYTSKTTMPGYSKISTESVFNKVYRYSYDIDAKRMLTRTRIDYPSTPPQAVLSLHGDRMWRVASSDKHHPPLVETIDPQSGVTTMTTSEFIANHAELQAGIYELRSDDNGFRIKTRDARDFYFSFATGDLFLRPERRAGCCRRPAHHAISSWFE